MLVDTPDVNVMIHNIFSIGMLPVKHVYSILGKVPVPGTYQVRTRYRYAYGTHRSRTNFFLKFGTPTSTHLLPRIQLFLIFLSA